MNLDILTKTGVGIIINKIRKESDNPEVATLGKNIIKQWKKLVPGEFRGIHFTSCMLHFLNVT